MVPQMVVACDRECFIAFSVFPIVDGWPSCAEDFLGEYWDRSVREVVTKTGGCVLCYSDTTVRSFQQHKNPEWPRRRMSGFAIPGFLLLLLWFGSLRVQITTCQR